MKRIFAILAIAIIAVAMPYVCQAAQEAPQAGQEIETPYFSVKLPRGWTMPIPVKNQQNGVVSAVFLLADGDLAITLNFVPAPVKIPEMAKAIAGDMKAKGIQTTPLRQAQGLSYMEASGNPSGQIWFGKDGQLTAFTMMFGKDLQRASELLKALKPVAPGLLPEKAAVNGK